MRALSNWMVAGTLMAASAQNGFGQTPGLSFELARLSSYSNAQLIWLLSRASIDRNLRESPGQGITYLMPSRVLGPPTGPSLDTIAKTVTTDTLAKTVTIPVHQDPGLSYIDVVVVELVQRHPYRDLLQAFDSSRDHVQLSWLEYVFSRLRGPEADSGLKPYAAMPDSEDTQYFALKYFAEGGTRWAFQVLNCHQYTVSSLEWADIVTLFGQYRYYPAAVNLAQTLSAASLNLCIAAEESLRELYPEAQVDYHSPEEAQKYWTRYVKKRQQLEYAPSTCYAPDFH